MDLSKLFDFLLDSNHKLSKRLLIVISGLLGLIFIDRMFKFSDNYITSKKLEQVEKIEKLLESDKIDSLTKKHLKSIEVTVLKRETAWDYLYDLYNFSANLIRGTSKNDSLVNNVQINDYNNPKVLERSVVWHTISSNWVLIALMFLMPFLPFLTNQVNIETYIGVILLEGILAIIVYLISTLLALIPTLTYPALNYLINTIIHFLLIYFISKKIYNDK